MMTLYLCRHAIAEEGGGDRADADRALTAEGVRKFRDAARGFLKVAEPKEIAQVFTSPLLRARQTAEIMVEALAERGHDVPVTIAPALGPNGRLADFLKVAGILASGVKGRDRALFAVGHEPLLAEWLGRLCFAAAGQVQFKKGAIAGLSLEPKNASALPPAELLFLLPPAILRRL